MTKIEARILTESEHSQWDQLVEQSPWGTIFHSSKWIITSSKSLNLDYIIIGVFDNSVLIGGCSFYIEKMFHFFKIGYTNVPLCPFGGIVTVIPKSTQVRVYEHKEHEIITVILEKIQTLNLQRVSLNNNPTLYDIRPFKQKEWTERVNYTYVISLDKDILSSLSHNVRTNIRKAQKNGFTVKKEYNPDLFWKLTKFMYDKQNIKIPFQKDYLFSLMEMLQQNKRGDMWIAETESGEAASAVFILYDNKYVAQAWVAANDPKFLNNGVISFILFEIFTNLQKMGFDRINLMGANIPRLANFYSSFNPKLIPYYSVQKSRRVFRILSAMRSIIY
jgi:hypothetical protein